MKKLFSIFFLIALAVTGAQAQNMTYGFSSGSIVINRTGVRSVSVPVLGLQVDTVQRTSTGFTSTPLRFLNNGVVALTIYYGPSNDSISGRTVVTARNLLNQAISAQRGNYLGAYTKAQLIAPDTATVGNYYYDTDTVSFRFKRASGGFQSLQPKN